ncbi:MAG TPA: hypothetical protein VGM53_14115 [Streptosporangiaceae bacterium]
MDESLTMQPSQAERGRGQAEQILRTEYPNGTRRERAVMCLSRLVIQMDGADAVALADIQSMSRQNRRVLEDACERGLLRQQGGAYTFTDASLRACLPELRADVAARRAARRERSKVLAFLTDEDQTIALCWALAAGVVLAGAVLIGLHASRGWLAGYLIGSVPALVLAVAAFMLAARAVARLLDNWHRLPRVARLAPLAAVLAVVIGAWTSVLEAVAWVLPATLVTAAGTWAWYVARRAGRGRTTWILKALPHLIVVATSFTTIMALADHDLLTAEPASGLLFPAAAWAAVCVWRACKRSDRLTLRAAADVLLSLMAGLVAVVFLVWLANLIGMPSPEMAALRGTLGHARAVADLPWWLWAVLYLVLAAAMLRPGRLKAAGERAVPAVGVTRTGLTVVHIGLLVIVLIAVAAPAALVGTFQRQARSLYTVAVDDRIGAGGEIAAYTAIRRGFSAASGSNSGGRQTIVALVTDITSSASGNAGTESDVARTLGALQATTLPLHPSAALVQSAEDSARDAGLDTAVRDAAGLDARLGRVQQAQGTAGNENQDAAHAGELAAKAIAATITIPHLTSEAVTQVIREYLGGLVEDGPLKNVFAAWAEHLSPAGRPPAAKAAVVPDPDQLKKAAVAAFGRELGSDAVSAAEPEPPLQAATDLTGQAVRAQDSGGSAGTGYTGGDDEYNGGSDDTFFVPDEG